MRGKGGAVGSRQLEIVFHYGVTNLDVNVGMNRISAFTTDDLNFAMWWRIKDLKENRNGK